MFRLFIAFILLFFTNLNAEDIKRDSNLTQPADSKESPIPDEAVKPRSDTTNTAPVSNETKADDASNYQKYTRYMDVLKQNPCDSSAVNGLLEIAKEWSLITRYQPKALRIYRIANECRPNNPELLFYEGRLLSWMGYPYDAEKLLLKVLQVSSGYTDAAALLIKIYIREKQWQKAQALIKRYPTLQDSQKDRALIAFRREKYALAEKIYEREVSKNPHDVEARRGLARTYSAEKKYTEAKKQYAVLLHLEPKNQQNWLESMDVKSHTDIGLYGDGSYTKAKENDPSLKAPVVRDFYTLASYSVLMPIRDNLRLDLKGIFFHQKEQDIYPPIGINYNAYVQGAELTSHYLFLKYLKWDLVLRVLGARGYNDNVFFPFQSIAKFEPGTSLIYSDSLQFLILNSHVESFIIKNFDKQVSQLLRTVYLHAGYLFRPPNRFNPELEVTFDEVFYHDAIRNRRNTENIRAQFDIFTRYLKFVYRFQQSNFRKVTSNYYSFKRQFRNVLGGILRFDFASRAYLEGSYQYRWEHNVGLVQPIGAQIFQAGEQRLRAYWVIMKAGYRLRDQFRVEVAGHLFYTTLPYEDYNIRANLLWQF